MYDQIAEIKARLPLLDYLEGECGLALKRSGSTYSTACPFHQEKEGSFTVWPSTNTWRCFGACNTGGDLFEFYQRLHNCDFKEALSTLAKRAGVKLAESKEAKEKAKKLRERGEILGAIVDYYHDCLQPEHREYLNRRGFKDEFIDSYKLGFAPGDCARKALPGVPSELLKEIGLLGEKGRDFIWNRITIPVYGPDGTTVVNITARRFVRPGEDDSGPRKYVRLPGPEQLINESALRGNKEVFLCEGDTDTPTLIQAGIPAVGVPGVSALKDEFAAKFQRIEKIFVCADGDKAGDSLIERAGALFGEKVRVVTLPDDEDINSFVGQKGGDIKLLAESAVTYLDWKLSRLPDPIPAAEADALVAPIVGALSRFGATSQAKYAKQIAKRFDVSLGSINEAIRESAKNGKNGHDKDTKSLANSRIVWKTPRLVNPAQDYIEEDKTMITTVFIDTLVEDPETKTQKIVTLPHIVTSEREVFELSEPLMYERGWRYAPTKVPAYGIIGRRWSTDETVPYSVKDYVDNKQAVNPWELHQELVGFFRRFVDYPNDLYYDLIALWIEATYFFNLYPAFPYLHFLGFKRVGKSRTLNLIAELAFNALWSASMSSAAAFRSIESCSATLLMDEAENLQKKSGKDGKSQQEPDNDKLEILKAGYQKGQKAIRCSGENNEPTGYDLYSPKAFGGTQALDRILGDRVIALILARSGRELEEFTATDLEGVFAGLRNKLYCLMLDYGGAVAEEIREGIRWKGVKDRDKELWTPILTLAQFIDGARLEEEPEPETEEAREALKESLVTVRMRRLAEQKVRERIEKEKAEQPEVLILQAIMRFMKDNSPINRRVSPYAYSTQRLLDSMKEQEEFSNWLTSTRTLISQLEKMTLVRDRKADLPRIHTSSLNTSPMVRCIVLDPQRVKDLAARYGAEDEDAGYESDGDGD